MNSGNKTLIGGGDIDGATNEAAGPGLLDEYQKLDGCKTGERKVTLGNKLPAMFHPVKVGGKNDYILIDFYKSCYKRFFLIM